MIDLDFFYNGNPVGIFKETEPPQTDGKYRYMPYRGYGHFSMQTDRRNGIFPRCYYDIDGEGISFTVIDCPEYGVLELTDFEKFKIIPKAKKLSHKEPFLRHLLKTGMTKPPYNERKSLNELIEQICLRPVMFVGSENFNLAAAFIEGFHYAISKSQPEIYSPTELKEFSFWLTEKFDYPRNYSWSYIRSVFPDDETTFSNLPLLYKEFINIK